MKLFIDTDVILDVVLERPYPESKELLAYIEANNKVIAFTTAIVLINTYYIGAKIQSSTSAKKTIQKLRLLLQVIHTTQQHIDQALASDFQDFEDAVQHYAAVEARIDYLITRNKADYKPSQIPVLSPQEFLAL